MLAQTGARERASEIREEAWQLDIGGTELGSEVGWALHELDRALGVARVAGTGG